ELRGEVREPSELSRRITGLDDEILLLDISQCLEPLLQSSEQGFGDVFIRGRQKADPVELSGLLRLDGKRCHKDGKGEHEERQRGHLITSSASISRDGGTVILSAAAVFRLMTSSNFIGCSMGRSAGLVPFRILSTYAAACHHASGRLAP